MPVSAGLQKYFDSQRKKSWDIEQKFASIAQDIDPKFSASFEDFRSRILGIVGNDEDAQEIAHEELENLQEKMQERKRQHDLKKAAAIIDAADKKH